jgi:hypothetical protein
MATRYFILDEVGARFRQPQLLGSSSASSDENDSSATSRTASNCSMAPFFSHLHMAMFSLVRRYLTSGTVQPHGNMTTRMRMLTTS